MGIKLTPDRARTGNVGQAFVPGAKAQGLPASQRELVVVKTANRSWSHV